MGESWLVHRCGVRTESTSGDHGGGVWGVLWLASAPTKQSQAFHAPCTSCDDAIVCIRYQGMPVNNELIKFRP